MGIEASRGVPNQRLKHEREKRGWSQRDLAKKIGSDHDTVSRWERGLIIPRPSTRDKLCKLFELSPQELGFTQEGGTGSDQPACSLPCQPGLYDPAIPISQVGGKGLVGRTQLLADLKRRLCSGMNVALSALYGLPGVGKTIIAVELARDREVLDYFRDGVLWAGLGIKPNIVGLLGRWGTLLGLASHETAALTSVEAWAKTINAVIGTKRMLLVIDDAWSIEDALAFQVGGVHCAHIVTTRFPEIALQFAYDGSNVVHELNEEDGIALLERLAPQVVAREPGNMRSLVRSVGGLPLAITLAGKYLWSQFYRDQPHYLSMALCRLQSIEERLRLTQSPPEGSPSSLPADTTLSLQAVINGLPGVGKTALAVELVHDREVRAHFRDGVLWAGLGPVPNVAGLLGRWGALLGVTPEHANIEGWQKAITAAIGERRMLLVIDDAWEIEDALAFRVGGPNCAHLVTTRFPVIAHRFAQGETIEVHELDEDNGLRLLERLAPEAVRSEPEEARALVRSIGGLPLALSLIGKYLYIQSYSGQPRRLQMALQGLRSADQRLHLTQPQAPVFTSPGHAPDAPLSLQSVISVSDQQLGEAARLALRALSIFPAKPNTFSMEAALAVCNTPLETIATLIEAGLLEQSDADRYTLHQTIADYARLHYTGIAAEERMAAYYVGLVEAHELDYSVLEQETDNVLAALQAAFELRMQAMLLRGANAFSHFLQTRGLFDIAEAQLKRAEQVARSGNDTAGLTTTLLNLGRLAERRGDFVTAQASYLEGLLVARQSGNSERLCDNLTYLGGIAVRRGELKQAAEYSQEALVLSEQSGYHRHSVTLLGNLGSAAFFQGNYADAQAYWQKALALARQQNHPERISALLENLGAIAVNHGDYEQGKALYHEALALARQIGQGERISSIYINLSEIALRQKDYAQVKEYSQEGLTIARQIGHVEIISLQLISLGEVEIGLENYEQAEDYLEEAFELAQQVGLPWLICYALLAWGKLYFGQRRLDLAATTFKETIEIARDANKEQVGFALYYLAQVTLAQGNAEEARQQGQESLDIFKELGHEKAKEVEEWLRRERT